MKYFKESKKGQRRSDDPVSIILGERVFSISKTDTDNIKIMEECDEYFCERFTKEQAIELFQEAIDWIKK